MGEKLKINPALMRPGAPPPQSTFSFLHFLILESSAEANSNPQPANTDGAPATSNPEKQTAPAPKLEHLTKNRRND